MRQIGTLADQTLARTFEDYLLTLRIHARVEQDDGQWAVWIYDEDDVPQARAELTKFRENPRADAYRQVGEEADALRNEAVKEAIQARKQVVDVRKQWQQPAAFRCPATYLMIALSITVAVLSNLGAKREPVLTRFCIAPVYDDPADARWERDQGLERIFQGEIWRPVTPIFVHFGILHILFNMLWLRDLGTAIEARKGTLRFILLVLAIAIPSNVGQYFESGPQFGGMSGVVFGLFGYIWLRGRYDPSSGFYMPPNLEFMMIAWFVLCITGVVGNIANTAHGVGLAAGMVFGYAPIAWRKVMGS